jgi:hypothetical protein
MPKITFDEALDRLNGGISLFRKDQVLSSALMRSVWVAEWHLPGCISESRAFCTSKRSAIESACDMATAGDVVPRGMKTGLRRDGQFETRSPLYGRCINTVRRHRLADLF